MGILKFVRFADTKVADGTMIKNHLIVPGYVRLRKWIMQIGQTDSAVDTDHPDENGSNNIYMGQSFQAKKDPEHLPAKNAWEHLGNGLRTIPRLLGSEESVFGFRVACATMTIGIVAFLENTQTFFIQQRLVWAMIIIGMLAPGCGEYVDADMLQLLE